MPLQGAEQFFRKGVARLGEKRPVEAARHFLTAMQLEREHGVRRPEMRYLSFYGLSLALARGPLHEAIAACQTAAERQPENPDLHLNLARVYLLAGERERALHVAAGGLGRDPWHRELRFLLTASDRRQRPLLRFLRRDHPVNRLLGRLRASLGAHEKAPPAEARGAFRAGGDPREAYQR
jgi:predicted Zn-dependent protease